MSGKPERKYENVLLVGRQMSNVLFNLSQMPGNKLLGDINLANLRKLQEQWDEAALAYRQSFKRNKKAGRA